MLGFLQELIKRTLKNQDRDIDRLKPAEDEPPAKRIVIGLDLGAVRDFTALCAVAVEERTDEHGKITKHYSCKLLHRWPLHTAYADIINDVKQIAANLPTEPEIVVDATGAGRPVCEMFANADIPCTQFWPVLITGGATVTHSDGEWHVAKRILVSVVQSVLQSRRLKVARQLVHYKTLTTELQRFRSKININTGNESFEAWREKDKDDLVLAAALALWAGEHFENQWSIYL
jgi:hypothetical protein